MRRLLVGLVLLAACDSHPCWPDGPPPQCTPLDHSIPYHPELTCKEHLLPSHDETGYTAGAE